MTKYFFSLLLLFISINILADAVNHKDAENVAKKFYYERINHFEDVSFSDINIQSIENYYFNNNLSMYIFKMQPKGFVIVSAESNTIPVIAYGFKENNEQKPDGLNDWLENYANQIEKVRTENIASTVEIDSMWLSLLDTNNFTIFNSKSVSPLLISNWDQGARYNQFCPEDEDGPGGRAYAGCVATAMSQQMYYYKYPRSGTSQHAYLSNYGVLSADFANANYKYEEMVKKIQGKNNPALAELMYHCGVSVEMNYTANGSGAQMYKAAISMQSYFNFSSNTNLSYKSSTSDAMWKAQLISSLDAKIPLIYAGYPSSGAGHAFNLDGYQGSDYFHFNWGWSGNYDGYFYLSALNPASNDFSFGQLAIFDAYPASNYPYYCTSTTINVNSTEGSFDDGSGPADDYQNNSDCKWLINPTTKVEYIRLNFDYFNITDPNDFIVLYDGQSTNDSIIDTVSINNYTKTFFSSGQEMLLRFITNGNSVDQGWHLSYTTKDFKYCNGNTLLTDNYGSFTDGSDTSDYMNNSFCNWYIKPASNPAEIKLNFSKFDLEPNKDYLKIYDPTTLPSTLLATYTGTNIPASVSAYNGEILLVFTSNEQNVGNGFTAHYVSGPAAVSSDFDMKDLKIYPNPAADKFYIENIDCFTELIEVEVFNQNGKLVIKSEIYSNESVDISSLESAVYIVKVNKSHILKLVKI